MTTWLESTPIANHDHPSIQALIEDRGWKTQPLFERVGAAYSFVKDEIAFGYNASDDLPASDVLEDGYGQCNTKGNLLLALFRALSIPSRFHGFTIYKALQKGAIPTWLYPLAPKKILHSWIEIFWDNEWLPLEGFILDVAYLNALRERFPDATSFCGYGAATPNLQKPNVEWCGQATFIQSEGIADDFGVFDHPDEFYAQQGTNLSGMRRLLYVHIFRHAMNATVAHVRQRHPLS